MAKYSVRIIETLSKVVEIEADSPTAAREAAEEMWFNGDIDWNVLDDHDSHEIYIISKEE